MAMEQMGRREFGLALSAGLAGIVAHPTPGGAQETPLVAAGGLTDVPGLKVGHHTETRRPTGCTVVLAEAGATCGVDVRGGAPGTHETDLLDPVNTVSAVHAVVLSGGSAFGLETASGVVRYLEGRKIGFDAFGVARVPIVPAAILFDLHVGDPSLRPGASAGFEAAQAASSDPVAEGSVGAGAGATVGKLLGLERAMKGGLGTASVRLPGGAVVAALVAVNAWGDIVDPATGRLLAGARTADGKALRGTMAALLEGETPRAGFRGKSTSIGVVGTNVALTKAQATKVAQMAHGGLARTINPVHTPWDGDTLFALSTASITLPVPDLQVGSLAAEVVARAVLRAVRLAKGLPGLPAASDITYP